MRSFTVLKEIFSSPMPLAVAAALALGAPFMYASSIPLIIAGGGGGAAFEKAPNQQGNPGGPGQITTFGQGGLGPGGGIGGTLGSGGGGGTGNDGTFNGGGGGGLFGNGGNGLGLGPGVDAGSGDGGGSSPTFVAGSGAGAGTQSANGGFGGGGGGGFQGGGGGGGFSGGGGGSGGGDDLASGNGAGGGGGGSFIDPSFTSTTLMGGSNGTTDSGGLTGLDGFVTIDSSVFGFSGSVVEFTVPATAVYNIVAVGAQGGGGVDDSGGFGAKVSGNIMLNAGTELEIAVGGVGSTGDFGALFAGGGGGGSFVLEQVPASAVPEPTYILLLSMGLLGVVLLGRRRIRKA